MIATSCPSVKRDPFGNDDNVNEAGDAVGIITEAEEANDDNTAVAELNGRGVNEEETRLPVSLDSKEE